jgi:5-methylcytosine-specific restriction endonuclease McrA
MSSKYHGGRKIQGYCGCGRLLASKGVGPDGQRRYRSSCDVCRHRARKMKDPYCNSCGIVPRDKSILEVDHKDGDRSNNRSKNLQTLCKPCHITKTKAKKDWMGKNAKAMLKV